MNENQKKLAARVILSDQLATELSLTEKESIALETGSAFNDSILEEMRDPITHKLPDGAEDLAVEKADKIVPGYGEALEKWAKGFRKTFIAGRG